MSVFDVLRILCYLLGSTQFCADLVVYKTQFDSTLQEYSTATQFKDSDTALTLLNYSTIIMCIVLMLIFNTLSFFKSVFFVNFFQFMLFCFTSCLYCNDIDWQNFSWPETVEKSETKPCKDVGFVDMDYQVNMQRITAGKKLCHFLWAWYSFNFVCNFIVNFERNEKEDVAVHTTDFDRVRTFPIKYMLSLICSVVRRACSVVRALLLFFSFISRVVKSGVECCKRRFAKACNFGKAADVKSVHIPSDKERDEELAKQYLQILQAFHHDEVEVFASFTELLQNDKFKIPIAKMMLQEHPEYVELILKFMQANPKQLTKMY